MALREGRLLLALQAGAHTYRLDGRAGPSYESPTGRALLSLRARDGGKPRWTAFDAPEETRTTQILAPERVALGGAYVGPARTFAGVTLPAARTSAAYLFELDLRTQRACGSRHLERTEKEGFAGAVRLGAHANELALLGVRSSPTGQRLVLLR